MYEIGKVLSSYQEAKQERKKEMEAGRVPSLPFDRHCSSVFTTYSCCNGNILTAESEYHYRCHHCQVVEHLTNRFDCTTPNVKTFDTLKGKMSLSRYPLISFFREEKEGKVYLDPLYLHTLMSDMIPEYSTHIATFTCGHHTYVLAQATPISSVSLTQMKEKTLKLKKQVEEVLVKIQKLLSSLENKGIYLYNLTWKDILIDGDTIKFNNLGQASMKIGDIIFTSKHGVYIDGYQSLVDSLKSQE